MFLPIALAWTEHVLSMNIIGYVERVRTYPTQVMVIVKKKELATCRGHLILNNRTHNGIVTEI